MGFLMWAMNLAFKAPVILLAVAMSMGVGIPFLWAFAPLWLLAAAVRTIMMFKGSKKDIIEFVNAVAYYQMGLSLGAMFLGSSDAAETLVCGALLSAVNYFVVERFSGGQLTAKGRVLRTKLYTGRGHEEAIGDEDGSGASFHDGRDDGVFTQGGR